MLKFIAKDRQTNAPFSKGGGGISIILTEQESIMLGYIDENNVFFPNNNMMFKVEWLEEIVGYIRKHGVISLGEIVSHYEIKDVIL